MIALDELSALCEPTDPEVEALIRATGWPQKKKIPATLMQAWRARIRRLRTPRPRWPVGTATEYAILASGLIQCTSAVVLPPLACAFSWPIYRYACVKLGTKLPWPEAGGLRRLHGRVERISGGRDLPPVVTPVPWLSAAAVAALNTSSLPQIERWADLALSPLDAEARRVLKAIDAVGIAAIAALPAALGIWRPEPGPPRAGLVGKFVPIAPAPEPAADKAAAPAPAWATAPQTPAAEDVAPPLDAIEALEEAQAAEAPGALAVLDALLTPPGGEAG